MTGIEVKIAENDDLEKWDTLVHESQYGTIFHLLNWLRIAEKHTKSKLYPLIGTKGEKIIGIFPLFLKEKGLSKMFFSPIPKTAVPYLGPVLVGYDQLKQEKKDSLTLDFYTQIDNYINGIKYNYVSFAFPPQLNDCRPFKWLGYQVEPEYNYLLDISPGLSKLEPNFTYRARKLIEKAEMNGMRIELGSKNDLKILYDILYDRYLEQGNKIPISKDYLIDIFDEFSPNNLKVFTLKYQNEIITGVIKLCYKNRIIDWVGHPKTIYGAGDFLHRETMKWGVENDYKYYEFIGANTPSISKFKSKFNPSLDVYFKFKKATFTGIIGEKTYLKFKDHLKFI